MAKKGIALIAALLMSLAVFAAGGVGMGAPDPQFTFGPPQVTFPPTSKDPTLTPSMADATVTISDNKLKAALYAATGLTPPTAIKRSDLAILTGGLDLSSKGIKKVDGLQYCENITELNLSGNSLEDLPSSFSKLTKLKNLILDKNKLTKIPEAVFSLTGLTSLSMSDNDIKKVNDKINVLSLLTNLDLSGNQISALPTNISKLSQLKYLNLSGNSFKTISRDAFLLPALESLDLSTNNLKEIPKEITSMPKLVELNVEENILNSLPEGLGSAPSLLRVYAAVNRLTLIEPTLLSGKVTDLTLDVNRIIDLPTGLLGKTFNTFSVEWNFIDMSEGSEARGIADSVNAPGGKAYLRQLKFLSEPQVKPTIKTVSLTWSPLEDGQEGDSSWQVSQYEIYLDKNDTWVDLQNRKAPIAELDKLASQYVVTGLKPDTAYKFQVGVEYTINWNGRKISAHRFYTPVETKTLAAAATAEPTVEPTPEPEPTFEESAPPVDATPGTAVPTSAPASASGGKTTLVILVIVGAVAALAIIGGIAMMMMKRSRQY